MYILTFLFYIFSLFYAFYDNSKNSGREELLIIVPLKRLSITRFSSELQRTGLKKAKTVWKYILIRKCANNPNEKMPLQEYVERILGKKDFEILGVLPKIGRQENTLASQLGAITSKKGCGIFVHHITYAPLGKHIIEILPLPEDYEAVSKAFEESKMGLELNMGQIEFFESGDKFVVDEMQQLLREVPQGFRKLRGASKIELPTPIRRWYFDYEVPLWYVFFDYAKSKNMEVLVPPPSEMVRRYKHWMTPSAQSTVYNTYVLARNVVLDALGFGVMHGHFQSPERSKAFGHNFYEIIAPKALCDKDVKFRRKQRKKRPASLRRYYQKIRG